MIQQDSPIKEVLCLWLCCYAFSPRLSLEIETTSLLAGEKKEKTTLEIKEKTANFLFL